MPHESIDALKARLRGDPENGVPEKKLVIVWGTHAGGTNMTASIVAQAYGSSSVAVIEPISAALAEDQYDPWNRGMGRALAYVEDGHDTIILKDIAGTLSPQEMRELIGMADVFVISTHGVEAQVPSYFMKRGREAVLYEPELAGDGPPDYLAIGQKEHFNEDMMAEAWLPLRQDYNMMMAEVARHPEKRMIVVPLEAMRTQPEVMAARLADALGRPYCETMVAGWESGHIHYAVLDTVQDPPIREALEKMWYAEVIDSDGIKRLTPPRDPNPFDALSEDNKLRAYKGAVPTYMALVMSPCWIGPRTEPELRAMMHVEVAPGMRACDARPSEFYAFALAGGHLGLAQEIYDTAPEPRRRTMQAMDEAAIDILNARGSVQDMAVTALAQKEAILAMRRRREGREE